MKKAKFKVGDRVIVQHVGECEVRKVVAINGVYEYVLVRGSEVFSVAQSEIQGVAE